MLTASLSELKKELKLLDDHKLLDICLRLARHKKENKELLHYLLLEAENEAFYIQQVKDDIIDVLASVNTSSFFLAKKTIRKTLRLVTKQIRFSGKKETEVEVLIFFCEQLMTLDIQMKESKVLMNLFENQVKKIEKAISGLHEDLQYDYSMQIHHLKSFCLT